MLLSPLAGRRPKPGAVLGVIRAHWIFALVLLAGAVLRVVAMLGFRSVLWFNDSYDFLAIANDPFPHPLRPSGYGLFLWVLKPFHSLLLVTTIHHAAIVGLAVVGYRMLVRDFDVRRGWGRRSRWRRCCWTRSRSSSSICCCRTPCSPSWCSGPC